MRELLRSGCRQHAACGTDEQVIAKRVAKTTEGVTDSWLAQPQPLTGASGVALPENRIEYFEKIEIDGVDVGYLHKVFQSFLICIQMHVHDKGRL